MRREEDSKERSKRFAEQKENFERKRLKPGLSVCPGEKEQRKNRENQGEKNPNSIQRHTHTHTYTHIHIHTHIPLHTFRLKKPII